MHRRFGVTPPSYLSPLPVQRARPFERRLRRPWAQLTYDHSYSWIRYSTLDYTERAPRGACFVVYGRSARAAHTRASRSTYRGAQLAIAAKWCHVVYNL
jgi:hypothetical protein